MRGTARPPLTAGRVSNTAATEFYVSRHLHAHLEYLVQCNRSARYQEVRRQTITRVALEFGCNFDEVTEEQVDAWYRTLTARVTPESRRVLLSHVHNYFEWLVKMRYREDNPALRLARPKVKKGIPRPIPRLDLRRALDNAPERIKPWLYLAAFQGMRAIEIANLRAEDLLETQIIVKGKGNKERLVPIHPKVRALLAELDGLPAHGYLFWTNHGQTHRPVQAWNVSNACNTYLHSLGIASTLHTLRHFFATAAYQESRDLLEVRNLLGHSDPATTAIYAQFASDKSQAVVAAIEV